jgi:hypothetical protein
MKYPVTRFKSMDVALKEIERFVKDAAHLESGRPFDKFGGMRPRELLANWLLCATIQAIDKRELVFYSDPIGGDGILQDAATGQTWQTEHVFVPRQSAGPGVDAKTLILAAIGQKRSKGAAAYASGKTLVVFLDVGAGEWFPNAVARDLPKPLQFDAVWVVGLHTAEDGAYTYGVTALDLSGGNAPTCLVRIGKAFDAWDVTRLQ